MPIWFLIPIATGLMYCLFALFVFKRLKGKENRGPYFSWCLATVFWHFFGATMALKPPHDLAVFAMRLGFTGIVFLPITILHFCAAFLESPSLKRWIPYGYLSSAFFAVTVWIDHWFLNDYYVRFWGYSPRAAWMHPIYLCNTTVLLALFLIQLTKSVNDPKLSVRRREQLRLIRRGLMWYSLSASDFLINYGAPFYPLGFIFSWIGLAHIFYAIVRHQFLDIQVMVRRALVYSTASTVLASLYAGLLLLTLQVLHPLVGNKPVVSVAVACALTALCHPFIRRIQVAVDRLFGRNRLDSALELMKFSSELSLDRDPERARKLISRVIEEAFHPCGHIIYLQSTKGYAQLTREGFDEMPMTLQDDDAWLIHLRSGIADGTPATSLPALPTEDRPSVRAAAPLVTGQKLFGLILLGPKRSEELYSEQDLILLRIVANQAAVAFDHPRLLKEVGSGFAHEVKTPLANIALPAELSYLELQDLERGGQDIRTLLPKVMSRLQFIMDQAELATQRVDALQHLTETEPSGQTALSLTAIAHRSVERLAEMAGRCGVRLESIIAPGLETQGNDHQIEIMFTNLIKNAIEALHDQAEPSVVVTARRDGHQVIFEVADSGPGLSPDQEAKAFEPHFTTKAGTARGMGLHLAQRIATAHRGVLRYQRCNAQTVFSVTLPASNHQVSGIFSREGLR